MPLRLGRLHRAIFVRTAAHCRLAGADAERGLRHGSALRAVPDGMHPFMRWPIPTGEEFARSENFLLGERIDSTVMAGSVETEVGRKRGGISIAPASNTADHGRGYGCIGSLANSVCGNRSVWCVSLTDLDGGRAEAPAVRMGCGSHAGRGRQLR